MIIFKIIKNYEYVTKLIVQIFVTNLIYPHNILVKDYINFVINLRVMLGALVKHNKKGNKKYI
jgi:hypothetical protein